MVSMVSAKRRRLPLVHVSHVRAPSRPLCHWLSAERSFDHLATCFVGAKQVAARSVACQSPTWMKRMLTDWRSLMQKQPLAASHVRDCDSHALSHPVNLPVDSHAQTRRRRVYWLRSDQVVQSLPKRAESLACFRAFLGWAAVQIRDRCYCYAGAAVDFACCLPWYYLDRATLAVHTRLGWEEVEGEKPLVVGQRRRCGVGAA
jgi:hypothetical protein